eukprot:CAMPEP_0198325048 /NCGR_PEP_ID=MMETSP1450-20131203/12888_1 /TAXON_ID=753684 ORGANISM="Madagascaria erythrocladiodes, Strain CCMP3234" /NCGR_SAMPLE_ID=MMETSP1450 /ASSEMBLY_ACC=CAM_ASM_001115 /LENGTH=545 /DNA_ID=CAMNT_0044028893 /DNA_START=291 /DNA_END=1928 /DNA_ORIENTATION=-
MKATKIGPYYLRETLGSGSFADVKLGIHEETGERFAIKVFDKNALNVEDFEREVRREVKIMQFLRHENIVTVHKVLMSGHNMYVVMELVSGGELYYEIVKRRRIDPKRARYYFQQLVDAMSYCHRKGVYHRDLKPENLLLDEKDRLKITDFGMSWMIDQYETNADALLHTQCGTPKYMAPEVITKAKQGYRGDKIDVWDCAMVLFAMLAGYLPFNGDDDRQVFRQIVFGKLKFPHWFDVEVCDLLTKMMDKNPDRRWSLAQVRKHPWFLCDYTGEELYRSYLPVDTPTRRRSRSRDSGSFRNNAEVGVGPGGVHKDGRMGRTRSKDGRRQSSRSRSSVRGVGSRSNSGRPGDIDCDQDYSQLNEPKQLNERFLQAVDLNAEDGGPSSQDGEKGVDNQAHWDKLRNSKQTPDAEENTPRSPRALQGVAKKRGEASGNERRNPFQTLRDVGTKLVSPRGVVRDTESPHSSNSPDMSSPKNSSNCSQATSQTSVSVVTQSEAAEEINLGFKFTSPDEDRDEPVSPRTAVSGPRPAKRGVKGLVKKWKA